MFKKICIGLVIAFVCVHFLLISLATVYFRQIVASRDPVYISHRLSLINTVLFYEKQLSFGAWTLPYLHEVFIAADSGVELVSQALAVFEHTSLVFSRSVSGNVLPLTEMETLFNEVSSVSSQLTVVRQNISEKRFVTVASLLGLDEKRIRTTNQIDDINTVLTTALALKPDLMELLGFYQEKHVVILTQNNMELWPTGGYLGSYAEFYFRNGSMEQLVFQDIGVPNGQIRGYVPAPKPISTYTHNGETPGWKLRESNWNPDFPAAMPVIEWFFTEGKVAPIDYMVAINLIPIVDLLRMIGPVTLPDYGLTLTSDNFYVETQARTSYDFFDGSTQKRDYLTALGKQLMALTIEQPAKMIPNIIEVVAQSLETKQILMAAKSPSMAAFLQQHRWDGGLPPIGCKAASVPCMPDFIHINEANMGVNKTNCCVDRTVADEIEISTETIIHHVVLTYKNTNPAKPSPPSNWGGGYKVYQRVYVPEGSRLLSITEDGVPLDEHMIDRERYQDKQVFGFLGLVQGGETRSYTIDYEVPVTNDLPYQLYVAKQSGIREIPWMVTVKQNGIQRQESFLLTRDRWVD